MCGIAGYFGRKPPNEGAIDKTLSLMKNRGPDHQAYKSFSFKDIQVCLLHSRLSIIDLDSRSNQPFTIGNKTIVYNGEIYNYVELRKALIDRGIELKTQSDTEVLLHYYSLYGEKCVQHFEGMWAFAIFDLDLELLFLSRDRFAEKPLYYIDFSDGFYFGSEIKFIMSLIGGSLKVNYQHMLRHLVNGYKALYKKNETYYEGVRELKYAENLILSYKGAERQYRYWEPSFEIDESMTLEDAIQGSRDLLIESMRIRMRSDVPLAFCLSGGVDSASLVSLACKEFNAKLETFSIVDSDERYNEEGNIMATVDDTECSHNLLKIPMENSLERLRNLIIYHDAPVATISYYVHSLISKAMKSAGYRVSFSGTSADELFTGYYDHYILHLNEVRNRHDYGNYLSDWRKYVGKYVRNPVLKNPDLYYNNSNYRNHVYDGSEEIKGYLMKPFVEPYNEHHFTKSILRNRMMNELFHEATPVILHEDDLNSMCCSIENRSPYLDTRLLKFANSIPVQHLIYKGYGKYILRESMKGILNEQVRLDRRKKGFNASINSMINLQDVDVRSYLLDSKALIFEFINRDKMEKLLDRFPVPNYYSKFIFNFINARIFLGLN